MKCLAFVLSLLVVMLVRAESEESKYQSQVLVCPDGKVSCSVGANGATCCPAGKTFMCCEYSDATCCNSYSCCPYWAPECNASNQQCTGSSGRSSIPLTLMRESKKLSNR